MSFIRYAMSLVFILVLAACGGGGGIAVVDPLKVAAPTALTIAPGSAASYAVTGGMAPYSAVSDNTTITTAIAQGNSLTVGGVTEGTSKVQVRDAKSTVVEITVTVSSGPAVPLFTTAPNALNMAPATSQTFRVAGGKAPYEIASDKPSAATVTSQGSSFKVDAVSTGVANLKITDSLGANLTVIVNVVISGVPLSVSPTAAQTLVAVPVEFFIVGGTPPYRVAGGIPSVLSTAFDPNNPGKLLVTPLLVTPALDITVLDSRDASAKFTISAIAGQPTIRLSPSALTVSERDSKAISLTVFGSTGDLTAFSSDLTLFSATTNKNVITVTGTGRCVPSDTTVTITAVDANRAIATSSITVKDNGNISAAITDPVTSVVTPGNSCPL